MDSPHLPWAVFLVSILLLLYACRVSPPCW